MTLQATRDAMIEKMVRRQIRAFLSGNTARDCASCGLLFEPRQRYHFFCSGDCRRRFYRGCFRPRKED